MHATRDGSRLRSASFHAFWAGAVLLFVGTVFLLMAFPAVVLDLHPQDPNKWMPAFLFGGLCFLAGLLSSIFSLISGIVVWVKYDQSCPWTVRFEFVLLAAILGTPVFLFGGLWLRVVLVSSIFSLISEIVVRGKYGRSCPWHVRSGFVLLAAILGTAAFLFGGLGLLVVLVSSILSLISGIVVWVKYGQYCPWPVLSGFVLFAAVLSWNIIVISAIVRRWL